MENKQTKNKLSLKITLIILSLLMILTLNTKSILSAPNSGAIWTTHDSCGAPQNINHYPIGGMIFINGDNFDPGTYSWSITGKPGGASADPGIIVSSGTINTSTGAFCFDAYTVQPDDKGEYSVEFGQKKDNYNVNGISLNKTANSHLTQEFSWTLNKEATPTHIEMFYNDTKTVTYDITITKSLDKETYYLTGEITLTNLDETFPLTGVSIIDCIQYNNSFGWEDFECETLLTNETVSINSTNIYNYNIEFTPVQEATAYRNIVKIVLDENIQTLYGALTFTRNFTLIQTPDSFVNNQAIITDTNGMEWTRETNDTISYTKTFTCENEGSNTNSATLVTENEEMTDSSNIEITCYELSVEKTAKTSFKKTWEWEITKTSNTDNLTLSVGEQYNLTYNILATATPKESDFKVTGNIIITNPSPITATINSIVDMILEETETLTDCNVEFPYQLEAEQTLNCTYTQELTDNSSRINTATVIRQNFEDQTPTKTTNISAQANIDFTQAEITELDKNAEINDTYQGLLGVATYNQTNSYTYTRIIQFATCGDGQIINNTASFKTSDLEITGETTKTVISNVACENSCTLTQGYWKTHSENGKAPYDDTWLQISSNGSNTPFFLSGKSYYTVMITPPKGNAYYQLAHQYIAAELNKLNGATQPTEIALAYTTSTNLFNTHTPNYIATLKASNTLNKQFITLAGTLAKYNEGTIGQGHCDEN